MKRVLYLLASILSVTIFGAPVFAQVAPTSTVLFCGQSEQVPVLDIDKPATDTPITCDLALKKEVSVNGTDFFDANTVNTAPQANIDDVITYKITVTDVTAQPYVINGGTVVVNDVLPSGLSFVSATPNVGTFTGDSWNYSYQTSATLTIRAKVLTSGNINNIAVLNTNVDQSTPSCNGICPTDMSNGNNIDNAYITVKAKPQVLGATTTATLVDTGSSPLGQTIVASAIILLTIFVARRKNVQKS